MAANIPPPPEGGGVRLSLRTSLGEYPQSVAWKDLIEGLLDKPDSTRGWRVVTPGRHRAAHFGPGCPILQTLGTRFSKFQHLVDIGDLP